MTDSDKIIDEIRASRCRMSQECGHDMSRYVAYLKQFNSRYRAQVRRYERRRRLSEANAVTVESR